MQSTTGSTGATVKVIERDGRTTTQVEVFTVAGGSVDARARAAHAAMERKGRRVLGLSHAPGGGIIIYVSPVEVAQTTEPRRPRVTRPVDVVTPGRGAHTGPKRTGR